MALPRIGLEHPGAYAPDGSWWFRCYPQEVTRLMSRHRIMAVVAEPDDWIDPRQLITLQCAPRLDEQDWAMLRLLHRAGASVGWVHMSHAQIREVLGGERAVTTRIRRLRHQRVVSIEIPKSGSGNKTAFRLGAAYYEGNTRCVPLPKEMLEPDAAE